MINLNSPLLKAYLVTTAAAAAIIVILLEATTQFGRKSLQQTERLGNKAQYHLAM